MSIDTELALRGRVGRLTPSRVSRVIEALTLVVVARAIAGVFARFVLGYRHHGVLYLGGKSLVLESERHALGRLLGKRRSALALAHLSQVTLFEEGQPAGFPVGLAALFMGTAVGSWAIGGAVISGAGSLFLLGLVLLTVSISLDFLLGSGRQATRPLVGKTELAVRGTRSGFVLSGVELEAARDFLRSVVESLNQEPSVVRDGAAGDRT